MHTPRHLCLDTEKHMMHNVFEDKNKRGKIAQAANLLPTFTPHIKEMWPPRAKAPQEQKRKSIRMRST